MFCREVAVWEEILGEFNSDSDNLSANVFIQVKSVFCEDDFCLGCVIRSVP